MHVSSAKYGRLGCVKVGFFTLNIGKDSSPALCVVGVAAFKSEVP